MLLSRHLLVIELPKSVFWNLHCGYYHIWLPTFRFKILTDSLLDWWPIFTALGVLLTILVTTLLTPIISKREAWLNLILGCRWDLWAARSD